jgi:predicted transcriptional regulator
MGDPTPPRTLQIRLSPELGERLAKVAKAQHRQPTRQAEWFLTRVLEEDGK